MAANYKCTSVGCYSYQSQETHVLFQQLQTRINQFLPALGVSKIDVDGIIGKGTTQATLLVLHYLAGLPVKDVAAYANIGIARVKTPEQLAVEAQFVVDLLSLALKQPQTAQGAVAADPMPPAQPQPSAAQIATTSANAPVKSTSPEVQNKINAVKASNPALATSILDRVPPWAAYASGAAVVIGTIAAIAYGAKKRKASGAPVVAGWW